MTESELSPAAKAVLDAINKELDEAPWDLTFIAGSAAAAALRAALDELAPSKTLKNSYVNQNYVHGYADVLDEILAIAEELEGAQ